MTDKAKYYIVEYSVLPEVFLKVVEAKKLIETEKVLTVQEAVDKVGISRSSFYKYKDSITPFYEYSRGKTITLSLKVDDEPGNLSNVLNVIANSECNILTIHQSIPINGVADISISIELLGSTKHMSDMVNISKVENSIFIREIQERLTRIEVVLDIGKQTKYLRNRVKELEKRVDVIEKRVGGRKK